MGTRTAYRTKQEHVIRAAVTAAVSLFLLSWDWQVAAACRYRWPNDAHVTKLTYCRLVNGVAGRVRSNAVRRPPKDDYG